MTGPWPRLVYFARRAGEAMVRRPRVALVAAGTVFVAVLGIGLLAASLRLVERLVSAWAGEVQISVYLDPAADLEAARASAASVAPGRTVEAVTAAEALRRFRASLGQQGTLLDGVAPTILPPSVEVRAPGIRLADARELARALEAVPGAREVDYGNAWLEPLERWVGRARWGALALFAALAAGAAVLVANTLRLGVFARREEIEIMKLVGATDRFVRVPFLVEGLLEGLAGGAGAAAVLVAVAGVALPGVAAALQLAVPVTRTDVLPAGLLLALVGAGTVVGLLASALAISRELGGRR